jgi:hypothetical protein
LLFAKFKSSGDNISRAKFEYELLMKIRDAGIEIKDVKIIKVNAQDVLLIKILKSWIFKLEIENRREKR